MAQWRLKRSLYPFSHGEQTRADAIGSDQNEDRTFTPRIAAEPASAGSQGLLHFEVA